MFVFFLLFLTAVFAKDPQCPEGFSHVKRVPTARNNHTKDWCLGVFQFKNMGNRDRARSFCSYVNASLTIPENEHEIQVFSEIARAHGIEAPYAVDGQISPKCNGRINKVEIILRHRFNSTEEKGDCNIKNNLFLFDDVNSDTTFMLSHYKRRLPAAYMVHQADNGPIFRFAADCIVLKSGIVKANGTETRKNWGSLEFCVGKNAVQAYTDDEKPYGNDVEAVLCGRHPL
ncbi:C-type lectin domain-containing protein [Caenorhabditis elegans]|uniref:C-type lectin domain-containing protein n=1 Tax=Caenorhabditis elegans TaxID=6239 RepID=Q20036_CAEEL|nr:C-type lectin domain-containing protein [Caenorhabditis elegans]CCD70534.1 C-type lectin domain-containing protein [Caenorhabditis elegans]|eukprot:NP_494813.2 C-type LECtin [Caenorhabditis elegans]